MKRKMTTFLSLVAASLSLAALNNVNAEKNVNAQSSGTEVVDSLNALLSHYVDNTYTYTKQTEIYLNEKATEELLEYGGFHAKASTLKRTTYYRGEELWMSRGNGSYSYYGTAEGNTGVTNASTNQPLVTPENAKVVLSGEGKNSMREYYVGLEDIVADLSQDWTLEDGVYTSTSSELIELFKAFTAPCYLGFTTSETTNYITLNKVSINLDENYNLSLKLYATGDTGKLTTNDGVFSEAKILFSAPEYSKDFDVNNLDSQWQVGEVEIYWGSETFTFNRMTNKNGGGYGFVGDDREATKDFIHAGKTIGISYTADQTMAFNSHLEFVGGTEGTRFSSRIAIKDKDGKMTMPMQFNGSDTRVLTVDRTIVLNEGDTVYFILNNEVWGDGIYPNGSINIKLTPVNKIIANSASDFKSSDSKWGYSRVDYHFGQVETFETYPIDSDDEKYYDGENIEIKENWIKCVYMCAVSYTAEKDMNVKTLVSFAGDLENSRISVRIAVKDANGNFRYAPAFNWNKDGKNSSLYIDNYYELKEGDTIYFVFGSESGDAAHGSYSINILEN